MVTEFVQTAETKCIEQMVQMIKWEMSYVNTYHKDYKITEKLKPAEVNKVVSQQSAPPPPPRVSVKRTGAKKGLFGFGKSKPPKPSRNVQNNSSAEGTIHYLSTVIYIYFQTCLAISIATIM